MSGPDETQEKKETTEAPVKWKRKDHLATDGSDRSARLLKLSKCPDDLTEFQVVEHYNGLGDDSIIDVAFYYVGYFPLLFRSLPTVRDGEVSFSTSLPFV